MFAMQYCPCPDIANLLPVNANEGRGAYCPTPQGTAHTGSNALGGSVSANHLPDNDGKEAYCIIHLRGSGTLLSVCVVMPSHMREGSKEI